MEHHFFIDLMQRCWDPEPEKRSTLSEIYDIICSWYYLKNYNEFKNSDTILLLQNKQNIENQLVQSTLNYLSRQSNSYHTRRIDLSLILTDNQFQDIKFYYSLFLKTSYTVIFINLLIFR